MIVWQELKYSKNNGTSLHLLWAREYRCCQVDSKVSKDMYLWFDSPGRAWNLQKKKLESHNIYNYKISINSFVQNSAVPDEMWTL